MKDYEEINWIFTRKIIMNELFNKNSLVIFFE